ncbi:MAG: HAD hydrolase-like protein, partial [Victivallaceae bacterium]
KAIKAVGFDLDGTLIDSRLDLANSVNLVRREFKLPPLPLDLVVSYVGNGVKMLVQRALEMDLPDESDMIHANELMRQIYFDHALDNTKLYDGVKIMLDRLAEKGTIMALFTNKPEFVAKYILEKLAVADYFSEVAGGGGKFPLKPNPEAMLDFSARHALSGGEIVMLGDHYTDLEFARRSSTIGVFAAYGFGEVRGEKYAYKIDNPTGLLDIVL